MPPAPALLDQRVIDIVTIGQEHIGKGASAFVVTMRLDGDSSPKARSEATAPGPLPGMRYQFGAHRIQHHVPAECQQVCLFFKQDRREPSLEEMPDSMMPTIVRRGIAAIQLAHTQRQIGLRRFDEEMIVIVHQAGGMTEPAIASDDMSEEREPV